MDTLEFSATAPRRTRDSVAARAFDIEDEFSELLRSSLSSPSVNLETQSENIVRAIESYKKYYSLLFAIRILTENTGPVRNLSG